MSLHDVTYLFTKFIMHGISSVCVSKNLLNKTKVLCQQLIRDYTERNVYPILSNLVHGNKLLPTVQIFVHLNEKRLIVCRKVRKSGEIEGIRKEKREREEKMKIIMA